MNIEITKKHVEDFNAGEVSALALAGEVPGLIAEVERLRALTINPGATLHGSTITEIALERDALRSQLAGMTGERDSERVIAQEWERKLEDLSDRYSAEITRVGKLQEELRFIIQACEDSSRSSDPAATTSVWRAARAEAIAEVARKALCL